MQVLEIRDFSIMRKGIVPLFGAVLIQITKKLLAIVTLGC